MTHDQPTLDPAAGGTPGHTAWACTWHAGPDAGACQPIAHGRHLLGRAAPVLRADDPALEPHHALVEVHDDGTLTLTQLTGKAPIRVDGTARDGVITLSPGAWVEVGGSLLSFGPLPAPPAAAHVHADALLRAPRAVPHWQPVEIDERRPSEVDDTRHGGLLPALGGLAGAGCIALVMHQPMFLLFGAIGASVAIAGWAAQKVQAVRRRHTAARADAAAIAALEAARVAAQEAFRRHHAATVPTLVTALSTISAHGEGLWARRPEHGDAFAVAAGLGDLRAPFASDALRGLAVPVSLAPGARLALRGPQAAALARALVVQLIASCGPADVRIVVVSERPDAWMWIEGLPHTTLPDGSAAIVRDAHLVTTLAELEAHRGHLLLVTDRPALLAARTSPLRRALVDPDAHALIVVVPDSAAVPHLCTSVVTTTNGPEARWVEDARTTMLPVTLRLAALGAAAARRAVASLRGLLDPEDPLAGAATMPRSLALTDLLGSLPTAASIAAEWAAAAPDPAPRALIGVAADGVVDIDLVRDGPHGLIAGTTGAGKSELLRTLVVGMAANASPEHLALVLVDYKGGATFDACSALPHVVGVITDLDDHLADRALRSLHAELRRREAILRDHGVADLAALAAAAPGVTLPRLVVVVDEFAALVAEQPGFLHALVGVAQRGRSLGVHLLLATQRPNGVISDDIRANTNLRLALRLQDNADALDVVGVTTPATLPRQVPGRAVLRLGADDHVTFQTARCTAPAPGARSPLEALVRSIGEAARLAGCALPDAPWQPPLPTRLDPSEVPPQAIGLVDDPDHQRTTPLRWASADGNVLVAGSAGSGVTSTLRTLALTAAGCGADVYVIDGRGDDTALDELAAHPRCGAVVRVHERERLTRLLHRLVAQSRGDREQRPTVVVIDGLDATRRALDDPATNEEFEALDEVLAAPAGCGLTVVAGVEHAAAVPAGFLARCATRWVLHLHDEHDAALLGVAASAAPPPLPGRAVIAGSGLVAQLVAPLPIELPTALPAGTESRRDPAPAPRILTVPAHVAARELPPATASAGRCELAVGIDFGTGDAAVLTVHAGDHLLIAGHSRSGRTGALVHLANQWQQAYPGGWVGVVTPRRPLPGGAVAADEVGRDSALVAALSGLPPGRPALVVVDDAEMVDDPDGRLAALAAGSDVLVIAAARPDGLRQAYGHWTGVLRRSRMGLVATGGSELDGDLLGAILPRRTPIAARPGLMWLVGGGRTRLVQVAHHPTTGTATEAATEVATDAA